MRSLGVLREAELFKVIFFNLIFFSKRERGDLCAFKHISASAVVFDPAARTCVICLQTLKDDEALFQHMRDKSDEEHSWYVLKHGLGPYPAPLLDQYQSRQTEEQTSEAVPISKIGNIDRILASHHISSEVLSESNHHILLKHNFKLFIVNAVLFVARFLNRIRIIIARYIQRIPLVFKDH